LKSSSANRVLIVAELHQEEYACVATLLEVEGIFVDCTQSVTQAMTQVSTNRYALALVDANLSDGTGLALCRQLTKLPDQPVPVIVRLAANTPAESLDGLEAGALLRLSATASVREIYLHLRNHLQTRLCAPLASPSPCICRQLDQCVLDSLPGALIVTNSRQRVIDANAAFSRLTGIDHRVALQMSIAEALAPLRFGIDINPVLQQLATEEIWQGELLSQHSENRGQAYWLYAKTISANDQSKPGHHIFFLTDIAHHKRREQRLRTLAETDALTGVANRNLFLSRLNEAIERARVGSDPSAASLAASPSILFLDLDGFKEVNDHLGHDKGDQLLRDIAEILQGCVRANDMIARLGGDEFAVLLIGASPAALAETAKRIVDDLDFVLVGTDGHRIKVTCSVGIAVYPADGIEALGLLKRADKAMYTVKGHGKHGYRFASDDLVDM
jgi:diguanylate cyclase (GGDEF)-like protein/PAS domain S-box-containing protein